MPDCGSTAHDGKKVASRRSRASCSRTPTSSRRRPTAEPDPQDDGGPVPHRHREHAVRRRTCSRTAAASRPYEALIVASLAQAEAGNKDDLGKVARVPTTGSTSGNFDCDCLQFDVTVNYWLELTGKADQGLRSDMTARRAGRPEEPVQHPQAAGLPLGPINNPGKDALQGAMQPAAGQLALLRGDRQGRALRVRRDLRRVHQRNEQKARATAC